MNLEDLQHLRWSLLLALVMILAGVVAVAAGDRLVRQEQQTHTQAVSQRTEAQSRLRRARDEEAETRASIRHYEELTARGIIGPEHRLDWVEAVRDIRGARKLADIGYEFAPQAPLDAQVAPGASGSHVFHASAMRLQLPLLHEGDLLDFLSDLRQRARAYVRLRACIMERLAGAAEAEGTLAPRLKADCTIDWITIQQRTEGDAK